MFILTIDGKEKEGAYAVTREDGEEVLYIFEEEDDAVRFAYQLEDVGYPEMHVIEVEDAVIFKTCETHDYKYAIITKNDIVIPPEGQNDFI
tara:strand:+ start:2708 stop:2980 length:273 start_codon:yes stop_codon:yes gene_type:complete